MGNMQTHIHNCVPVENPRVSFWPWSTLDTGTEAPAYINGAFLLCGGKPHTHSVTRTHSQGNPLTYSHAPALCKCQTVGERVYLGAVWYFYTFVTASLSHTHIHKLGLPTLPIQWRAKLGLGTLPHCAQHKTPKHSNIYALRRPFMSLQRLTKCQDQSQCSKWWVSQLKLYHVSAAI